MRKIYLLPSIEQVIIKTADIFKTAANEAIQEKGRFSVALSGGSTPLPLYEFLGKDRSMDDVDWQKIHFFWVDERPVPPDHPDSNFGQANQTLLLLRQIPDRNIHRIQGELDPALAAESFQQEIEIHFTESPPVFDLILLGMGTDGHTASLFPGTAAINNTRETVWLAANHVPQHETWRITFTPGLINASALVLFLVTGPAKADTIKKVLEGPYLPEQLPSQLINPTDGSLIWVLDQKAGSLLSTIHSRDPE